MRTPFDLLPDLVLVPLVGKAVDLHTCDECGRTYPDDESNCPHGRSLCPEDAGWACVDCSNDLSDTYQSDLADDMRDDARMGER